MNDTSTGDLRLGCLVDFRPTCRTILAASSKQDEEEVIINSVAILFTKKGWGEENFIERKINSAARWRKAKSVSST